MADDKRDEDYQCKKCRDTAWISKDVGGLAVSERCECIEQNAIRARTEGLVGKAQIPRKYALCDLENFVIPQGNTGVRSELQKILTEVKMFAREFPIKKDPHGLMLCGSNGVGKTHLAVAALRLILARGHDCRFVNYQELLRLVKAGYDEPFGRSRTAAYDEIEQVELLLVDDIGSNRVSGWVEDTVTDLIAQRHDSERATIVTTNYSPSVKEDRPLPSLAGQIGERATSRLREMCKIITMPALPDHRGTTPFA